MAIACRSISMTVIPGNSPCLKCLFTVLPDADNSLTCETAGIVGTVPAIIGSLQATEAMKYLLGLDKLLAGTLLTFDALEMDFRAVKLNRNPNCPLCGENPEITELKDEQQQV